MRLPFAGAVFVVLGGCTLLVDTDGYSGGAGAADGGPPASVASNDGGDSGNGGSGSDGGGEPVTSTPADGGDAGDGGSDGGNDGGGGGISPCKGTHLFCDDFDTGETDPWTRWGSLVSLDGATFAIDASDSVSAARSLKTSLLSGTGSRLSLVRKLLATSTQDVTVGFDIRMEATSSMDFGDIDWVQLNILPELSGGKSRYVILNQYGDDAAPMLSYYHQGVSDKRSDVIPRVKTAGWQHLTIRLTPVPRQATITVDGQPAGAVALDDVPMTSLDSRLGFDTDEAKVTQTVRYDNVTVDEH